MIRITMLYPAERDARFDFDYYINQHLPLSKELLANYGFLGYEVAHLMATSAR